MEKIDASFTKADPDSAGPNVVVLVGMGGQGVSYADSPFTLPSVTATFNRRPNWRLNTVESIGQGIKPSYGSTPPPQRQRRAHLTRSLPSLKRVASSIVLRRRRVL
ncbi:MAG: hypothetical protein FRX48_06586 [Lasallia pustulata]|uniref:Uncharacterized protein n=1 Tax=Lasallia pustulata TaxID=136370 RepID=A0A5M8PM34_9LECA|nr:MAG: hypothetical protein FRX48_06586 [Lasallia pustulata]